MTDLRKAAEMALEVLKQSLGYSNEAQERIKEAKQSLRQALAQPEQEPVAWVYNGILHEFDPSEFATSEVKPLYTAPPKPEWVGLTEKEFSNLLYFDGRLDHVEVPLIADFIRAIQAKLKEKNT